MSTLQLHVQMPPIYGFNLSSDSERDTSWLMWGWCETTEVEKFFSQEFGGRETIFDLIQRYGNGTPPFGSGGRRQNPLTILTQPVVGGIPRGFRPEASKEPFLKQLEEEKIQFWVPAGWVREIFTAELIFRKLNQGREALDREPSTLATRF